MHVCVGAHRSVSINHNLYMHTTHRDQCRALFSSENDSLLGRYVNKYIEKVFGESTNITSRIEDSQSFRLFIFALLIAAFLVIRFLLQFIEKTTNRVSFLRGLVLKRV